MLQTQVDYWKLQEQKRSNLAQERLKQIELDLRSKELDETTRHDLAGEAENLRQHLKAEEQRSYEIGNTTMDVNTRMRQADIAEVNSGISARQADASALAAQARMVAANASQRQASIANQRAINEAVTKAQERGNQQQQTRIKDREIKVKEELLPYDKAGRIIHGAGEAAGTSKTIHDLSKPKGGK